MWVWFMLGAGIYEGFYVESRDVGVVYVGAGICEGVYVEGRGVGVVYVGGRDI